MKKSKHIVNIDTLKKQLEPVLTCIVTDGKGLLLGKHIIMKVIPVESSIIFIVKQNKISKEFKTLQEAVNFYNMV